MFKHREAHRGNASLYLQFYLVPSQHYPRRFNGYNLSLYIRHPYDKSVANVRDNFQIPALGYKNEYFQSEFHRVKPGVSMQ